MTARVLREKYEQELMDLQSTCPHIEVSDWLENQWAPGHTLGAVRCCLLCEKIVEHYMESTAFDKYGLPENSQVPKFWKGEHDDRREELFD